jgi:hypothetical protein
MKTSKRRSPKPATKPNKEPKLLRTHAPADLSPVDWQRRLRRQFGREQPFGLENLTTEAFFSEFRISNPRSGTFAFCSRPAGNRRCDQAASRLSFGGEDRLA